MYGRQPAQHPRQMNPEEAEAARRMMVASVDNASSALIGFGVNVVKKNPIKIGFWVVGLLLGFLAQGTTVTPAQIKQYNAALDMIPHEKLNEASYALATSRQHYEASRGWFWTCNTPLCLGNKARMERDLAAFSLLRREEHELMKDAKQSVGLFSEHGVQDTREMFWQKFNSGKAFASRQTKWDIIFTGISAIGRDEKIANFLFRIVSAFLLNITVGLCGAVIAFWWNLWGLVQEYRAGLLTGLLYFCAAGLAAGSFALLWLFGIYAATAGTVFVAAKVLATNVRIEDTRDRPHGHLRHD